MKNAFCIALLAAAFAAGADAGEVAVARLVKVTGNVLVSDETSIASASESLRLKRGMRILVTFKSAAVVEYDDGCRVKLDAGERLEIRGGEPCAMRAAAPMTLANVVAAPP